MNSEQLFCAALNLQSPWFVENIELKQDVSSIIGELHIRIGFERGSRFFNSKGRLCSVHDSRERTWQHMNFFQHRCFIHARVPRIKDAEDGKVETVTVPWARPESGFTMMFEAYAMMLIENEVAVNKVASMLGVGAQRIWGMFNHYVGKAVKADDLSEVSSIGVDETSISKGHNYMTVVMDMDAKRTIFVVKGKDACTLDKFVAELAKKHGKKANIKWASIDMSPAFISGLKANFPKAAIVFDKFHLMKLVSEAIDQTRRQESKDTVLLKGHRYTFLKNRSNLSRKKQVDLEYLSRLFPTLGEAYKLRETLQLIWEERDPQIAVGKLETWCDYALNSKVHAFKKVVYSFKAHWSGIVTYFQNRLTNAILENTNLKIQSAKRRARGFRNPSYFKNMIYFLTAKLNFYPHYSL